MNNFIYYLVTVGLFVVLKLSFRAATLDDVYFLLMPTSQWVGMVSGSEGVYIADKGFYHEDWHILINISCSGFHFWMLSFLLFTYTLLQYVSRQRYKIVVIPLALLGTYLLTLFANTSRIVVATMAHHATRHTFPTQQSIIHEGIGVIINLTFLILAYIFIEKVFRP